MGTERVSLLSLASQKSVDASGDRKSLELAYPDLNDITAEYPPLLYSVAFDGAVG